MQNQPPLEPTKYIFNAKKNTALHNAIENDNQESVFSLLNNRDAMNIVNIKNNDGNTPLHYAIMHKRYFLNCYNRRRISGEQYYQSLLEHEKIDPNICNNLEQTPLHIAVGNITFISLYDGPFDVLLRGERDTDDIISLLEHPKTDINKQDKNGDTPAHCAAKNNDDEALQLLINNPQCNLNITNNDNKTVTNIVYENNFKECIKLLGQQKINNPNISQLSYLNKQDSNGDTRAHRAAKSGIVEILKLLINDPQRNLNITNKDGDTPAHCAAKNKNPEALGLIVNHSQYNPNITNKDGDTPAHCAAKNNDDEALQLLIANGKYNLHIKNKNSETAVDIIYKNNFKKCVELIEQQKNNNPNIPQPSLKAKLWQFFYAYNTALKISAFGLSCIILALFMINKR